MTEFLNKNWYVDLNEADLSVCVIRFIKIGQEMPELANRSDLSSVPICHRDQYCKINVCEQVLKCIFYLYSKESVLSYIWSLDTLAVALFTKLCITKGSNSNYTL